MMIRKQLYITESQERALKRRAREEGQSEAEIARRALGTHLSAGETSRPGAPTEVARRQSLNELLERTRQLAQGRRLSTAFRERYRTEGRAMLYEERQPHATTGEDVEDARQTGGEL